MVLALFCFHNIASANPDLFSGTSVHAAQNLAVWSKIQKYGVEYQSLMSYLKIAREAFRIEIDADQAISFMNDSGLLTPEIRSTIDFSHVSLIGDKLNIGHKGSKGLCIISLSKASRSVDEMSVDSFGRLRVSDLVIDLTWPEKFEDVTGGAEGDAAIHEGKKERRGFFEGLAKGKWKVAGDPGVNDVIREYWDFWRFGKGIERFRRVEDLFKDTGVYHVAGDVIRSIRATRHKLYIYDTPTEYFAGGVSTHYGIRNNSVHMTRDEFERLEELGSDHLAARMAHEVYEIEAWKLEGERLKAAGEIKGIGKPARRFDDDWSLKNLRGWMRANSNPSLTGRAQVLDRKIHQKALEVESSVVSDSIIRDLIAPAGASSKVLIQCMTIISDILTNYPEILSDPGGFEARMIKEFGVVPRDDIEADELRMRKRMQNDARSNEFKKTSFMYSKLERGLLHFRRREERRLFLNILFSRIAVLHASIKGGAVENIAEERDIRNFISTGGEVLSAISHEYPDMRERQKIRALVFEKIPALEKHSSTIVPCRGLRTFVVDRLGTQAEKERFERVFKRVRMQAIASDLAYKVDELLYTLENVEYLDDDGAAEVNVLLGDIEDEVAEYDDDLAEKVKKGIRVLRELMAEKNANKINVSSYPTDPDDIVGASSQAGFSDTEKLPEDTAFLSRFNARPLGEMSSDKIADNLIMQADVTGINSPKQIRELMRRSGNWNYATLDGEGVTQATFTAINGVDQGEYFYISRFGKKPVLSKRLDNILAVSDPLLNGTGGLKTLNDRISSVIGENTPFRMFAGSRSGYFEVIDNADNTGDDFQHSIDITFLTDDYRPLEEIVLTAEELNIIRSYIDDVNVGQVKVSMVGLGQLKRGFMENSGLSEEVKRRTQRLFLKLYREDVQVVGDSMVRDGVEAAHDLKSFEVSYIKELIYEARELEDDVADVTEEDFEELNLSQEEQAELADLEKELSDLERRTGDPDEESLSRKRKALAEERQQLQNEFDMLKEEESLADLMPEGNKEAVLLQLQQKAEKYEASRIDYLVRLGELDEEASGFEQKKELEDKIRDLAARRDRVKEIISNSRRMELLLKKVEDAQFSLSQDVDAKAIEFGLIPGVVVDKRYRIKEKIGEGGFGVVYRVYDIRTKREAALKIVLPNVLFRASQQDKEEMLKMFSSEITLTQRLGTEDRASVPLVGDRGKYLGVPYFVMTFERGRTLEEILKDLRSGKMRLDPRSILILMHVIARAVHTVHNAGVILRDIKPSNIMIGVDESGEINFPPANLMGSDIFKSDEYKRLYKSTRVLDMGIAIEGRWLPDEEEIVAYKSAAEMGEMLDNNIGPGTFEYMPGERFTDNSTPITGKSDNYALGVMMYRLLSFCYPQGEKASSNHGIISWHVAEKSARLLRDIITEENHKLREKRKVVRSEMEEIEKGLTRKLAQVTKRGQRVMILDDRLYWHEDVMDEDVLRDRLGMIDPEMPGGQVDAIVRVMTKCKKGNPVKINTVDGYIEALVDAMLRRELSERPTVNDTIDEIGKYLTGRKDEMIYRPKDEKKEWLVEGARFFQRNQKLFAAVSSIFAAFVTSALVFVGYLYHKAMKGRQQALKEADAAQKAMIDANRQRREAEEKTREAQKAAEEADKRLRELNAKSAEIQKALKDLAAEKKRLENEQAKLINLFNNQEKKKAELNEKIQELEQKQKEMRDKEKVLNEGLLKLAESRDKAEADLKAKKDALVKMKLELEKYQKSMDGVFEAAKKEMKNLEPEKAVDIVRTGVPYWRIDADNLKRFSLGFDEVVKIAVDRKQFKAARELESKRAEWLEWVQSGKSAEARMSFTEGSVKSHIYIVRLLAAGGDHKTALDYAGELSGKKEFSSSKERMEALRVAQAEVYIDGISRQKVKSASHIIKEAGKVIGAMGSSRNKNFYNGRLYFATGSHDKAIKYFGEYRSVMDDLSREKDIAAGVKSQRKAEAAYALLLQVGAHYKKALAYRAKGDSEEVKDSLEDATKVLDEIERSYPEQKVIKAYMFLMKGDVMHLAGKADKSKEWYAKAQKAAVDNGQDLILMVIDSRLGVKQKFSSMDNTWSLVVSPSSVRIPTIYLPEIKMMLDAGMKEMKDKVEEEKRRAEEARLKEEIKRRREAQALREKTELRRSMSARIKDLRSARRELSAIKRTIQTLNRNFQTATDEWDKNNAGRQLERAKLKEEILIEIQQRLKEQAPKTQEGQEADKNTEDEQGAIGNVQLPIANDVFRAPDHRLVNAVLRRVLVNRGLSEPDETRKGIGIVYIGKQGCNNLKEVYDSFSEEDRGKAESDFRDACRADGVPDEIAETLWEKGLPDLKFMSGHAGIQKSRIYIVSGKRNNEELKEHETLELLLHQQTIAAFSGYKYFKDLVRDVPEEEVRTAIRKFRENPGYNEYARRFHEIVERKVSVGGGYELIPDSAGDLYRSDPYVVPAADHAEDEKEDREWDRSYMVSLVKLVSQAIKSTIGKYTAESIVTEPGKSVIVFADDIIDNAAVFDLEQVSKLLGNGKGSVLGKLVLYAENPLKADILRELVLSHNPEAVIDIVTGDQVKAFYGEDYYRIPDHRRTEALLRYMLNTKSGHFSKPSEILGVVRGPLTGRADYEDMRNFMALKSRYSIHVVVFTKPSGVVNNRTFSLMHAVLKLLEANKKDIQRTRGELLIILPPAVPISHAMHKAYREYIIMARAMGSAA